MWDGMFLFVPWLSSQLQRDTVQPGYNSAARLHGQVKNMYAYKYHFLDPLKTITFSELIIR